jgi:hypothetical protein
MLGGLGMRGRTLTSVELTHGDPLHGPWIRVETAPAFPRRPFDLQDSATNLWFRMEQHPPSNLPPGERQASIDRRFQERRARNTQWTRVTIPVQGQAGEFDWLDEKTDSAARGVLGDLVLTIHAHHWPSESVRLVILTDVETYLEGDRRFSGGDPGSEE